MARIDNSINSPESFQILECLNEDCRFRFPRNSGAMSVNRCPKCRHEVRLAADLAFAQELPDSPQPSRPLPIQQAILDNIRSAWNVGSMFRTADGLGIRHLTLCGITPTPENPAVAKTSLGAEKSVAWRHFNNSLLASKEILASGTRLWALEWTPEADPLERAVSHLPGDPIALIVGNEISGIDPGLLEYCERTVYVPMAGIKRSFNVAVAFGIAAHYLQTVSERAA